MPEGHTLHRLARGVDRRFRRALVAASSPQGRFAAGAQRLDGTRVVGARAHGKHLLVRFAPADAAPPLRRRPTGAPVDGEQTLHVHLGLYGTFVLGAGEPPPVRGALRLRLVGVPEAPDGGLGDGGALPWGDLRGPTACELLEPGEVEALEQRLGPDPLQPDPDGTGRAAFVARVGASRSAVGGLLMRQDLVAGIGNVYRAEVLFRAGVHPERPGRAVGDPVLAAVWDDLVVLMRAGVRTGRIVTTEPEHRLGPGPGTRGRAGWRDVAHYVYRRTGLPCRLCGTAVLTAVMVGRNVFWCPVCQPA